MSEHELAQADREFEESLDIPPSPYLIEEEPKKAQTFDYIYNPDGTCGARWDCSEPGVVLAYDDFSPETATWFCSEHWEEFGEDPFLPSFLIIVEDNRQKEVPGTK